MALSLYATFTPSGFLNMVCPPPTKSDPTGAIPAPNIPTANTLALPAGSSPATVLIANLGPETAYVSLSTAVVSPTGTALAGSTAVALNTGTSVVVGQAVIGAGVAEGSIVAAISGSALTLSKPTTAALSGTPLSMVAPVTYATGQAVNPNGPPLALDYVASGFISAINVNGASRAVLSVAVGV